MSFMPRHDWLVKRVPVASSLGRVGALFEFPCSFGLSRPAWHPVPRGHSATYGRFPVPPVSKLPALLMDRGLVIQLPFDSKNAFWVRFKFGPAGSGG